MKKVAAISLIILFFFNLFGYRILFAFAQHQSDTRLVASLDNESYNEAELLTIKVPLTVPYQVDQADFERVDGEVNYQGKIYKYVKRKMEDGQLILLCLPDNNKMRLQSAKDDFFKNSNDVAQNDPAKKSANSKTGAFKNILSDYITPTFDGIVALNEVPCTYSFSKQSDFLATAPHNSPEQPPDFI